MLLKSFIVIYYLATVFGHKEVNEFIDILYKRFSYHGMDRIFFYLFTSILVAACLYFTFKTIKMRKRELVFLIIILIIPVALYYFLFFVSSVEAIHFIQYAILSLAIIRLYPNVPYVFVSTAILGIVDEMYQYFILYKGAEDVYLDYNDMLFNVYGSVIGIILGSV